MLAPAGSRERRHGRSNRARLLETRTESRKTRTDDPPAYLYGLSFVSQETGLAAAHARCAQLETRPPCHPPGNLNRRPAPGLPPDRRGSSTPARRAAEVHPVSASLAHEA